MLAVLAVLGVLAVHHGGIDGLRVFFCSVFFFSYGTVFLLARAIGQFQFLVILFVSLLSVFAGLQQ